MNGTDIEQGIVTALQGLVVSGSPVFAKVDSFPGTLQELTEWLINNTPAAWVKSAGGTLQCVNRGAGLHLKTEEFVCLLGVSALNSASAAKESAQTIEELVRSALAGQDLSLAIQPLSFTRFKLLGIDQNVEFWEAAIECKYLVTV